MRPRPPTPSTTDEAASWQRLLVREAAKLGLALSDDARARLLRYQGLLAQWGDKINLTALRTPEEVVQRHFLDSLALVRELPSADKLRADELPPTLVDVGSGAGFPGVLCALFRPDLRVTLVERVGKKAAFLLTLRRELELSYEVAAEDVARLSSGFGLAVSRAALPLADWLPCGARLVVKTGWVFAMTTSREPIPNGLFSAELSLCREAAYDVGAGPRLILVFRKRLPA